MFAVSCTIPVYFFKGTWWGGRFFTLGDFGDCGEVSLCGWRWSTNGNISLLSYYGDVGLVPESSTDKDLAEFFWYMSLLHCFSSVVSTGQIYGNIPRYW